MHQIIHRVAGAKALDNYPLGFMNNHGDFMQLRNPNRDEISILNSEGSDLYSETHPMEVS
jgi:hypothetical protein